MRCHFLLSPFRQKLVDAGIGHYVDKTEHQLTKISFGFRSILECNRQIAKHILVNEAYLSAAPPSMSNNRNTYD